MKTHNLRSVAGHGNAAGEGRENTNRATSRGVRIIAPGRDIEPVTTLRVTWAEELEDDEALLGDGTAKPYTNDTGATLAVGDVVVLVGDTVQTTTLAQDTRPVGVVIVAGDDGNDVVVQTVGKVDLVNVTASVSADEYGETSATAGQAQASSTRRVGSFCVFLSSGTAPSALLFGIPDTTDETEDAADLFLARRAGEGHVVSTTPASGSALDLDLSSANWFDITLTDDCTLTFSGALASGVGLEWTIILRGDFTVTWPAEGVWKDTDGSPTSTPPAMTGDQNVVVVTSLDGGTSYGLCLEGDGPGSGASALGDLTDVTITSPQEDDTLRYVGGVWINDDRRFRPVTHDFGSGPELVWDGDDLVMEWF